MNLVLVLAIAPSCHRRRIERSQEPHFQTVFAAGRACGWVDEAAHRIDHVPFGVVLGTDGKKFKTRSGDTVRLVGAWARLQS